MVGCQHPETKTSTHADASGGYKWSVEWCIDCGSIREKHDWNRNPGEWCEWTPPSDVAEYIKVQERNAELEEQLHVARVEREMTKQRLEREILQLGRHLGADLAKAQRERDEARATVARWDGELAKVQAELTEARKASYGTDTQADMMACYKCNGIMYAETFDIPDLGRSSGYRCEACDEKVWPRAILNASGVWDVANRLRTQLAETRNENEQWMTDFGALQRRFEDAEKKATKTYEESICQQRRAERAEHVAIEAGVCHEVLDACGCERCETTRSDLIEAGYLKPKEPESKDPQ